MFKKRLTTDSILADVTTKVSQLEDVHQREWQRAADLYAEAARLNERADDVLGEAERARIAAAKLAVLLP